MPAEAKCPHCQLSLRVPSDYAGKSVKCPQCQQRFVVGGSAPGAKPTITAPAATPQKPPGEFEELIMSVLNEGEEDEAAAADAHVEKVKGPSRFWRCAKCDAVWEKKPLASTHLEGSRIKAMVRCETCGGAFDYAAVHGGKYDVPEISLTCPKCHLQLSGPADDLLDKPCPACGAHLPKS